MSSLATQGLSAGYTDTLVVRGLDLHVDAGEIVALIGPNGCGKSTVLKAISGLLRPISGVVELDNEPIQSYPARTILGRGVRHLLQDFHVFPNLTVADNLRLGSLDSDKQTFQRNCESVFRRFPVLEERLTWKAGKLSKGQQQQLNLGRVLVAGARILLLDEPTAGLSPDLAEELLSAIREESSARGLAVLMVEHRVKSALSVANRVYGLREGTLALHAAADVLLKDTRQVAELYFL